MAVIAAGLVGYIIGMLWYMPALFGKAWLKLSGLTEKDMKEGMTPQIMLLGLVASLLMAYVLAAVIGAFDGQTIAAGLMGGFWIWLGFVATTSINSVLYEKKSWTLFAINTGYYLVALLAMGAILAGWR